MSTAAEQLAEMAAKNVIRDYEKAEFITTLDRAELREIEYRAVLRWFAAEVERRAIKKQEWNVNQAHIELDYFRVSAMFELLRELSIDSEPESRCCRICGEVVRGPKYDGLCGLCYDDQLNKRANEAQE